MIQVKELINTTNKEEFINKKTLRRLYAEHSLVFVDMLRRGLEEGFTLFGYHDAILDCGGMAYALGIITDDELDCIVSLSTISTELVKPLAIIATEMLDEYLQNL